jgi:hypothetical protein
MYNDFTFSFQGEWKKHRHIIMMHKTEYILLALFDEAFGIFVYFHCDFRKIATDIKDRQ